MKCNVSQNIELACRSVLLNLAVPGVRVKAGIPGTKLRKLLRGELGDFLFDALNGSHMQSVAGAPIGS